MKDTIFAQSSAFGKVGVAVFRISGPDSKIAAQQLMGEKISLQPRYMHYCRLHHPVSKKIIDDVMMVYFKAPASFTGEDVIEIYTHGSIAVSSILIDALLSINNIGLSNLGTLRIAEPGEFTRRAFLNDKFDLVEAEGISDLINAETAMQHCVATNQMSGGISKVYDSWRARIIKIIALMEAYVDFPDEEIPEQVQSQARSMAKELNNEIISNLSDSRAGELLRSGIKLAIIGRPNSGKSSLINFLIQREVSIVSNSAGTTRDLVEAHLDIAGYPIILQDTAGIREDSNDAIEIEGIRRAKKAAMNSDIIIVMHDASCSAFENNSYDKDFYGEFGDKPILHIFNKIDLIDIDLIDRNYHSGESEVFISLKNMVGVEIILQRIEEIAKNITKPFESIIITRARHRDQLLQASSALSDFLDQKDIILALEDLRIAARATGSITGRITLDEILDDIFSNFCIGK